MVVVALALQGVAADPDRSETTLTPDAAAARALRAATVAAPTGVIMVPVGSTVIAGGEREPLGGCRK